MYIICINSIVNGSEWINERRNKIKYKWRSIIKVKLSEKKSTWRNQILLVKWDENSQMNKIKKIGRRKCWKLRKDFGFLVFCLISRKIMKPSSFFTSHKLTSIPSKSKSFRKLIKAFIRKAPAEALTRENESERVPSALLFRRISFNSVGVWKISCWQAKSRKASWHCLIKINFVRDEYLKASPVDA